MNFARIFCSTMLAAFAAVQLVSPSSFASLGGSIDTLERDRGQLQSARAIKKVSAAPLYSIHTIEADSVSVNEFVSQQGIVFGITWSGIQHPDLESLLGSYEPEYTSQMQSHPPVRGLRQHAIQTSVLTVEKWGHPRHLQGRAFALGLIPKGVSPNEIR